MFLLFGIMGAVLVGSAVVGVMGEGDLEDEDAVQLEQDGDEAQQGMPIDPTVEDPAPTIGDLLGPTEPDEGGTQFGTAEAEIIDGGAGDDILNGYEGDDQIYGYEGDDVVFGDEGDDLLSGGAGDDELCGEAGDDTLEGGAGDDELRGYSGEDTLEGGEGNDVLIGGEGDDLLDGGAGDDNLEGGIGNDVLTGGAGSDNLNGGTGDDVIDGSDDFAETDWLMGGDGDDLLVLGDGDVASGGAGNDVFALGPDLVEDTVAEIMDFNIDEDGLALLWDDAASADAPEISLGESDPDTTEIYADGELIGIVHGGAALTVADVRLVPMSASGAL